MKTLSTITISLDDDDRELLKNVNKILEGTVKVLDATDIDTVDLDDIEDYDLIENAYIALSKIYNAL